MLLADYVIKRLRTPLAIQCLIHLRSPFLYKTRPLTRLHTHARIVLYTRLAGSLLGSGYPTAHEKHRLMLLDSSPDMVHGFPLRKTETSSLLTGS